MKNTIRVTIIVSLIMLFTILSLAYIFKDEIYIFYQEEILKAKDNITIEKNEYFNEHDYKYIQLTEDFIVKDKQHLLNIFYTIVNSGTTSFTFYCDKKYESCIKDVIEINKNKETLSYINSFAHPFNRFDTIYTTYDKYGEINVEITKTYTNEEITYIEQEVNKIMKNEVKKNMNTKEKIRAIHDYIINKSKYATDKIKEKYPDASFNKASYMLENKYGTCNAYADLMSIFLYELKVNNISISSDNHIWNLIYIDKDWYHLDLTWDDPVMSDGSDRLESLFFIITTKRLNEINVGDHSYNSKVFKEAN